MTDLIAVIFRVCTKEPYTGTVDAFFPELPGDNDPLMCTVYSHVGQHSSAHYSYYREDTRPATPKEYGPLMKELTSLGYNLSVKKRWTKHLDSRRFKELERMDRGVYPMSKYLHTDTTLGDGCYITLRRDIVPDDDADPRDYLFESDEHVYQDQARLDSFTRGEWCMIGVRAKADILIVKNNVGTSYCLHSAGVYGVESDCGEEYLRELYEEQKKDFLADLKMFSNVRQIFHADGKGIRE